MPPPRSIIFLQNQNLNENRFSLRFNESHSLEGSRLDRLDPIEINGSFASALFWIQIFSPSFKEVQRVLV